jgi:hypothetical protein
MNRGNDRRRAPVGRRDTRHEGSGLVNREFDRRRRRRRELKRLFRNDDMVEGDVIFLWLEELRRIDVAPRHRP